MLNYTAIDNFFDKYPEGYINIVQSDCVFKFTNDIAYSLDETSIRLFSIYWTDKMCGNYYRRKGNFIIPFNHIIRIEYIKEYREG